jgi:phenylacetate-CoA ligase
MTSSTSSPSYCQSSAPSRAASPGRRNWRSLAINSVLASTGSQVPGLLRRYRALEATASPGDIAEYQRRHLLGLLRHCWSHVPWYRRQLESSSVDLSDSFATDQLARLPVLTKESIRDAGESIYSTDRGHRGAFPNSSGGSTGKPVVFLQDRLFVASSVVAAKFIYNEVLGKCAGDPEINLWGSQRDIQRGSLGIRQRAINFLYNRRFQNFFVVDDAKLARFVGEINKHKPVSIWAYVESMDLLAKFIRRNNLGVHSPRFIISTAGTLLPGIRTTVQEVFRCPVYNQYGSRELGAIAFEMQDQDGLRGLPYLNYTEVVNGKVVVTSLTNYSMPFLRYEIGDTAEPWTGPQDPEFGCRHKVFQAITGRTHSHFKTAEGGIVHGLFFTHQFYFLGWVAQFQVVQDTLEHISCYVVAAREPVKADMEQVRKRIRGVMGEACAVEFILTDRIAPSESGKHLYTISRV